MTSYNPMARVVKRAKLNLKKDVLWDTLIHTSWICSIWHLHQPPTLNLTTACLRSLLTNAGLTSARLACGPNMPQIFSFLEFCILSLLLVKMASAWEETEIMSSLWSSSLPKWLRSEIREWKIKHSWNWRRIGGRMFYEIVDLSITILISLGMQKHGLGHIEII